MRECIGLKCSADDVVLAVQMVALFHNSDHRGKDIANVIDLIALQTNLIAINATIHVSRADAETPVLVVVAGEMRELAKRSLEAANEIRGVIE